MEDFLFADFLEDHAVYAALQAYWQARLAFLDGQCAPYLRTTFAKGHPFYDGNPIVNLADGDEHHRPAQEKIIVLSLTPAAAQRAEDELRAWFAPA